jgi:exodeoxyribonuclease V alpha subunit
VREQELHRLQEQGILAPVDVHFTGLLEKLAGGLEPYVSLAAALVSRSTREGHICLNLGEAAGRVLPEEGDDHETLVCPELEAWCRTLQGSPVVGRPGEYKPLVLDDRARLYLFRYWDYQERLARLIGARASEGNGDIDPAILKEGLDRLFPPGEPGELDWQKVSAFTSVTRRFSVLSGGPGTGKTTTVAKILALLLEQASPDGLRIALAAPTGKGAVRLEEAIRVTKRTLNCREHIKRAVPEEASTIHRLLGSLPASPYFRHDAEHPLAVDVVVVDEASMVDLALMSKLAQALPSRARLILLGDRDQLASVEAGAVLGDICDTGNLHGLSASFVEILEKVTGYRLRPGPGGRDEKGIRDCIVQLEKSYRFGPESGINRVSRAVNAGQGDLAVNLLRGGSFEDISWTEPPGAGAWSGVIRKTVIEGFRKCFMTRDPREVFPLLEEFRILCALRKGPYGVTSVNEAVEKLLREARLIEPFKNRWYPGRPILVTRNDYHLRLFNGDVGVILPDPEAGGALRAFFPGPEGTLRRYHPLRLPEHETVYAMTVHKSQGSEYREVLLLLPDRDSPLLTRELIYTGITRARERAAIWGPESVFRTAVSRRIERRSGLRDALWGQGVVGDMGL